MQAFRNLVTDSTLVQEAVDMLRQLGGSAHVAHVADVVLRLPELDPQVAALVIAELIKDDWRLRLTDAFALELTCEDDERRALTETDFVVFDVETTGAKMPPGRITEIGAYRVSRGRIVAEFQTLVNPEITIPPFIVNLTGITDAMVKNAPRFDEVAHAWLEFAGTDVLVAHNAAFDVRFINHELARVFPGRRMVNAHLCTVSLSRRIMPDLANHRLHTLAAHYEIPFPHHHRAWCDAQATAGVFINLLGLLDRHGVRDLAGARRFRVRRMYDAPPSTPNFKTSQTRQDSDSGDAPPIGPIVTPAP